MNDASGSILTPLGRISVSRVRRDGHVTATLTVPPRVTVFNHAPESYTVHIIRSEK